MILLAPQPIIHLTFLYTQIAINSKEIARHYLFTFYVKFYILLININISTKQAIMRD